MIRKGWGRDGGITFLEKRLAAVLEAGVAIVCHGERGDGQHGERDES